jgi:polyhydroxyalkanoate synthesis regulator phasin
MATGDRKSSDSGVVGRLAGRGEEAMSRLMDELGRNRKLTEGLTRALAAKGMLDTASRTALTQVGLAPAEDVRELRRRVTELEKRLAKLESGSTRRTTSQRKSPAKTSARAKGTSASKSTRSPAPRRGPSGQS